MLGQRHRRWASIGPALIQRLVFPGSVDKPLYVSHQNGIINYASYTVSTVHRSHSKALITKAIDSTSISYQPLWLCCWRGDISSFLFTRNCDLSSSFICRHYYVTSYWSQHMSICLRMPVGDHLYTSESDVCWRQILMYKNGPRTERTTIFIMAVDSWHICIQMNRKEVTKIFMMLSN